ncbi:MAG: hypothetical protein IT392_01165 [Nitrospirae bacterium]|nr:hypothetical protein [Nitrospirota bacterium]
MIIEEKSYEGWYIDVIPVPAKNGFSLRHGVVHAPVFLDFMKADLSSYEGFQVITEKVGLNVFAYLDQDSDYKFPLDKQLKDIYMREYNQWNFSESFIKQFYERNKERMQEDQDAVKLFYKWYYKKDMPVRKPFKDVRLLDESQSKHLASISLSYNPSSGQLNYHCRTLPGRCYIELIELIRDKKEIKTCAYCGELFVSHDAREIYCDRPTDRLLLHDPADRTLPADFLHVKGYESSRTENIDRLKSLLKRYKSCKDAGAQKKYIESKSPEEKELIRQKKQFQNRLLYLKEIGNDVEYKKVLREFNKWQKEVSHGKTKLKG